MSSLERKRPIINLDLPSLSFFDRETQIRAFGAVVDMGEATARVLENFMALLGLGRKGH